MAKQAAFDTSWMNLGAEAFLDPFHQVRQSNGRFLLAHLANECEDLLGELVRLLGTALVWHQAGKTVLLEGRLCLVERWPRKTEICRRIRHGLSFGPHAAQHLVLDLDQIPGIEEAVLGKQRIGDCAGPRIEGSLLLQDCELGILFRHMQRGKWPWRL